jgi:hypothetical protein
MRFASHIVAAASAATGRSVRPIGWLCVGACTMDAGFSGPFDRTRRSSRLKPE